MLQMWVVDSCISFFAKPVIFNKQKWHCIKIQITLCRQTKEHIKSLADIQATECHTDMPTFMQLDKL